MGYLPDGLLGMASLQSGDLIQSQAYYEHAVALFRELNDRRGLASSLVALAFDGVTFRTDRAEMAVNIAREIGWRSGEAYARMTLGIGFNSQGDYTRALDLVRQGLEIAEEIEHREWMTCGHCWLGALYLDLLALPEARQHLERALALAHEMHSVYWIHTGTTGLISVCVAQRDVAQAESCFKATFGPHAPDQPPAPQALFAQTELALARGDASLALQSVDQVVAFLVNMPDNLFMPQLSKWRGEALAALHRDAEAEAALLAAQETAATRGLRPILWRIQIALGNLYHTQARHEEAGHAFMAVRTIVEELAANVPDPALRDKFLRQATAMIPPAPALTPRQAAKKEFGGLTARERQVAVLVAQGKSNREIADALVVSERTVENHVGNILSKLGFTARAQIAVWAVEKGLAE